MPEDFGDRLNAHEAILRHLTAMLVKQDGINERLEGAMDTSMARMDRYMARQDVLNELLDSTQAAITTLLQRIVRGSGNGREA